MRRSRGISPTASSITRWRPGEIERTARQIARAGMEEEYLRQKVRYDSYTGRLSASYLLQGRITSFLRDLRPALLFRMEHETRLSRRFLEAQADTWEVWSQVLSLPSEEVFERMTVEDFAELLPRPELPITYYGELATAVKYIEAIWSSKIDITRAAVSEALKLLKSAIPNREGSSPSELAGRLLGKFGLLFVGASPFSGMTELTASTKPSQIVRIAVRFHPSIQDEFKGWAKNRIKRIKAGEEEPEQIVPPALFRLTITLNLPNPPQDLEELRQKIEQAITNLGIGAEIAQLYPKMLPLRSQSPLRMIGTQDSEEAES